MPRGTRSSGSVCGTCRCSPGWRHTGPGLGQGNPACQRHQRRSEDREPECFFKKGQGCLLKGKRRLKYMGSGAEEGESKAPHGLTLT